MKKLIIANWKMNPQTEQEARELLSPLEHRMGLSNNVEVVVCPPFVFLPKLSQSVHKLKLGAQNMNFEEKGADTGEISATELKSFGVEFVILGHSERRIYEHETDQEVNQKILMALKHKITPVVCLGGGKDVNKDDMGKFVTKQFHAVTKRLDQKQLEKIIFVYEPAWAISTMEKSQPATGEHARELVLRIRTLLAHQLGEKQAKHVRILYGGTVNQNNVAQFAKYPEIDGALVGAASLDPENFWEVIKEFAREAIHV